MPFAKDRDLLVYEPTLFRDVGWSAQRLGSATGATLAGTALTTNKVDFEALGITSGHVVMVNGAPLEVVDRVSAEELTVSLLRASIDDPPLPPLPQEDASIAISTFLPQITVIHETLMRSAGIEPSDPEQRPNVSDVTNSRALVRLEALGALNLILAAAAATSGDASPAWARALMHKRRFIAERARLAVAVDLNDDGAPDALRPFDALRLERI